MKRAVILCVVLAAAFAFAGCSSKEQPQPTPSGSGTPTAKADNATQPPIAQKLCPVMGDPINPSIYVDYKGRRVYFCCKMCPPMFEKAPEKYIKILDEQLKAAAPKPAAK